MFTWGGGGKVTRTVYFIAFCNLHLGKHGFTYVCVFITAVPAIKLFACVFRNVCVYYCAFITAGPITNETQVQGRGPAHTGARRAGGCNNWLCIFSQ
jgi:hypothetical protein